MHILDLSALLHRREKKRSPAGVIATGMRKEQVYVNTLSGFLRVVKNKPVLENLFIMHVSRKSSRLPGSLPTRGFPVNYCMAKRSRQTSLI